MGFKLNDVHSDTHGICVETVSLNGVASKRQKKVVVMGRDGEHVFEDGYNNCELVVRCSLYAETIAERRKKARDIMAWLSNTGTLVMDYEPDVEYDVISITNDIKVKFLGWNIPTETFEVSFECVPYQKSYYYNDELTWDDADIAWGLADIPWEGYERTFESVSDGDTLEVYNLGTYTALPIIKLSGTASTVTVGTFTFTSLSGDIYVDCDSQVVYSLSGDTKVNEIATFSGEFLELASGNNEIAISGTITDLDIEFDFKNTYL